MAAALAALAELPEVDDNQVVVVGHDYGAMYGALLADREPRVAGLAALAPDATWEHWFLAYWLGRDSPAAAAYPELFAGLQPVDAVARVAAHRPVLLQFADDDGYVDAAVRARFDTAAPTAAQGLPAGRAPPRPGRAQRPDGLAGLGAAAAGLTAGSQTSTVRAPATRVTTTTAAGPSPASRSCRRSSLRVHRGAALLHRHPADAAGAQQRPQPVQGERQHVGHPVARAHGVAGRPVRGHVRDRRVEQPAAEQRGDHLADEPGPDHRAVRLVQPLAQRADRRRPRAGAGWPPGARRPAARRPARVAVASGPNHSAASFTSPPTDTHSASTPAGTASCGMPGATLATVSGTAAASSRDEGQRRRAGPRVEDPPPAPAGPPRRVEARRAAPGHRPPAAAATRRRPRPRTDRAGQAERRDVGPRHRDA